MRLFIMCATLLVLLCGCRSPKNTSNENNSNDTTFAWQIKTQPMAMAMPPIIVYKTRADYNNLIPIRLDSTGNKIESVPDPSDVHRNDGYATPTQLDNGYLIDRCGISKYSAFLDYTYEQYAALDSLPSEEELMSHIVDKRPFVEMWNCGRAQQYNDLVADLNSLAKKGFPGCNAIISPNSSK